MMISGSSLVLFLYLVPVCQCASLIIKTEDCGEKIEIPTSGGTSEILTAGLRMFHETEENTLLSLNESHESSCTENGNYCIRFGDGRRQMNLTVHSVTFQDRGKYALSYETNDTDPTKTINFHIMVTGMCEPKLSSSTDNLTCEVDVESDYNSTIFWMDKRGNIYKNTTFPKSETEEVFTKLQDTFKLTDETRGMEICCNISSVKEGEKKEKLICQIRPSHVGTDKVEGTDNDKMIIIPILLVLVLAICVALFLLRRRRMSFTQKRREDHQAENLEDAPLELLQRPQDQV
ncbi:uncharacterized protein [Aquarana catesbeiana]|uniref:uncharacterized protein isoform X2 n=1 Tax=Aquarana catesbeiana TaxID=8400 RepID=UPI003CC9645D